MKYSELLYILILIVLFPVNIKSQDVQEYESTIVKLKIENILPVGWGYRINGTLLKTISGDSRELGDTIRFGLVAGSEYEEIYKDSTYFMKFVNSNKQNELEYLPAINGCVSKKNELWYITGAFPVKASGSEKEVFTGHAVSHNGNARFVWDMALSESLYLEGLEKWDKKYLDKRLIIQGELKTIIDGVYSGNVITDWKIIKFD